jgi:hypothetical protein
MDHHTAVGKAGHVNATAVHGQPGARILDDLGQEAHIVDPDHGRPGAAVPGIPVLKIPQNADAVGIEGDKVLLVGQIAKTGKTLRVSQLTEYAFDLATSFTNFYEHPDPEADVQIPFIHLRDQEIQTFRLSLVTAFQKVMRNMLNLMGMPALERI